MSNELIAAIITIGILVTMFAWSLVCDRACEGRSRAGWKPSKTHFDDSALAPVRERPRRHYGS